MITSQKAKVPIKKLTASFNKEGKRSIYMLPPQNKLHIRITEMIGIFCCLGLVGCLKMLIHV